MALSLVLDVPITFESPSDAGKSRLSEILMFNLQSLKLKEVMNKQRINATELLLYLWLYFVTR